MTGTTCVIAHKEEWSREIWFRRLYPWDTQSTMDTSILTYQDFEHFRLAQAFVVTMQYRASTTSIPLNGIERVFLTRQEFLRFYTYNVTGKLITQFAGMSEEVIKRARYLRRNMMKMYVVYKPLRARGIIQPPMFTYPKTSQEAMEEHKKLITPGYLRLFRAVMNRTFCGDLELLYRLDVAAEEGDKTQELIDLVQPVLEKIRERKERQERVVIQRPVEAPPTPPADLEKGHIPLQGKPTSDGYTSMDEVMTAKLRDLIEHLKPHFSAAELSKLFGPHSAYTGPQLLRRLYHLTTLPEVLIEYVNFMLHRCDEHALEMLEDDE